MSEQSVSSVVANLLATALVVQEPNGDDPLTGCYEQPDEATEKQGGIFSFAWSLAHTDGEKDAYLDGDFTARDLIAIALYMLRHQTPDQA